MVEIARPVCEELKEEFEHCESLKKMSTEEEPTTKVDVEEGELPEDGEITEDEEENKHKDAPSAQKSSSSSSQRKPPPLSTQLGKSSAPKPPHKYKDFDAKTTKPSVNQDAMLSSWVTGVQKKSHRSPSGDVDPNEEYYGVASNSADESADQGDADFRALEAGVGAGASTGDKDFREHVGGIAEVNEYGDADFRKPPNVSPPRFERRRRRSSSPDDRFKRGRFDPSPIRRRGGPMRTRWTERTICKFFREGYCRDGDHCAYSHNASDSHRRPEVCKFYQHGYCKKGLACMHLHGEFPCKAFHKGECSKNPCQFSHQPLNDFTKPIFDQMMRDEELASRITVPQAPMRRKVLLPQGPDANPPSDVPMIDPSTGNIPPPGVVVPVMSSPHNVPPADRMANANNGSANFGFFNPVAPSTMPQQQVPSPSLPRPTMAPPVSQAALPPVGMKLEAPDAQADTVPSIAQIMSGILQSSAAPVKIEPKVEPVASGAFNIDQMLQSITQQVAPPSDEIDESPASPPAFGGSTDFSDAPIIPATRAWKLIPVNVESNADVDFELKLLQQSTGLYKNDPRVKKLAEKQFDLVTKSLELQAAKALLASAAAVASTSTDPVGAKPIDPRTSGRDPRLRTSQPASSGSPAQQPAATSDAPNEDTFRSMVEQQIQMANQLAAQQAREQPPFDAAPAMPMPPHAAGGFPPANPYDPRAGLPVPHPPNEQYFGQGPPPPHHQYPSPSHDPFYDNRGGMDRGPPPRFRGRGRGRGFFRGRGRPPHFEGNGGPDAGYGNHSPSQWNYDHERGAERPPAGDDHHSFANAQGNQASHVSLREKRKHNEYESPLA